MHINNNRKEKHDQATITNYIRFGVVSGVVCTVIWLVISPHHAVPIK